MEKGGVGRCLPVPPEDVMGQIIHFDLARRAVATREPRAGEGAAQILFFTGVRYTAYVEPTAPAPRVRRASGASPTRPRRTRKQA